jgi:translation elongation factor EF-Tu-like GTPase
MGFPFHSPYKELAMQIKVSLSLVDPNQLEWVMGGMNKAELVSGIVAAPEAIREGGRTVGAGNVGEILA